MHNRYHHTQTHTTTTTTVSATGSACLFQPSWQLLHAWVRAPCTCTCVAAHALPQLYCTSAAACCASSTPLQFCCCLRFFCSLAHLFQPDRHVMHAKAMWLAWCAHEWCEQPVFTVSGVAKQTRLRKAEGVSRCRKTDQQFESKGPHTGATTNWWPGVCWWPCVV